MRAIQLAVFVWLGLGGLASAQPAEGSGPRAGTVMAEGAASYFSFGNSHDHAAAGGLFRVHLTSRLSVGAESNWQVGAAADSLLLPSVIATIDLREPRSPSPGRVEPFSLVSAGFIGHGNDFGSSAWPALAVGAGVRIWTGDRFYVTADARTGLPSFVRVNAGLGIRLR
jgi:hypothetical protein